MRQSRMHSAVHPNAAAAVALLMSLSLINSSNCMAPQKHIVVFGVNLLLLEPNVGMLENSL